MECKCRILVLGWAFDTGRRKKQLTGSERERDRTREGGGEGRKEGGIAKVKEWKREKEGTNEKEKERGWGIGGGELRGRKKGLVVIIYCM